MRLAIGVIAVVVLIFLGVILLRGPKKTTTTQETKFADYSSTDAQVSLTMDGVINSEEAHRTVRITIGRSQRTIDVLQGYQNHVLNSQVLDNNESAYNVFLNALYLSGYTKTRKTSDTDSTGQCPLGSRYTYTLINAGDSDTSRWSTTCGSQGTFGGSASTVRTLFERQIPNFQQVTQGVGGITF